MSNSELEYYLYWQYKKACRTKQRYQSRRWLPILTSTRKDLCSRCKRLDLKGIFSKKRYERVVDVGYILSAQGEKAGPAQCVLCSLLAEVNSWKPGTLYELRSFPNIATYATYCLPKGETTPVMLGSLTHDQVMHDNAYSGPSNRYIRCSNYLCPEVNKPLAEGPSLGSAWLDPYQIEFSVPKRWIQYCRTHHQDACQPLDLQVVNIKVIDCFDNSLVPVKSSCEYLALSYVWGPPIPKQAATGDMRSNCIPDELPPTVRDAISITKQLGFRYLWIDRYCINQEEMKEKLIQINQMDAIYQGAVATLVAAAGETPNYGLPGAGTGCASRTPQLRVKVAAHTIVSTYREPSTLVQKSKWMTRGWTMQEALLSRRLLLFTNEQLYYECGGMECCEAVHYTMTPERQTPMFPSKLEWSIFSRIENFSRRELSHQSDALNAFLGILRFYQRMKRPVHSLWGTPIVEALLFRPPAHPREPEIRADIVHEFLLGLFWMTSNPGKRRPAFPSWSWVGWEGDILHCLTNNNWIDGGLTPAIDAGWDVEVDVELGDGQVVPLGEFRDNGGLKENQHISQGIWISSTTICLDVIPYPVFLRDLRSKSNEGFQAPMFCARFRILGPEIRYAYTSLGILDDAVTEDSDMSNCFGILCPTRAENFKVGFARDPFSHTTTDFLILVVHMSGEHEAERIGSLSKCSCDLFDFEREEDVDMAKTPTLILPYSEIHSEYETDVTTKYMKFCLR